jgi:Leucine-rich repeat (LRR) protein
LLLVFNIHAVISDSDATGKCWPVLNTTRLHLQCNLVPIPDDYFNKFEYLVSLHLSNSKIQKLSNQTFNGLDSLDTLNLNDNELTDLPDGVFEPLMNIKEIGLSNNNLSSIDLNQFANH